MVHTRGQGARPEGFSEYQPAKRERKACSISPVAPMASLHVARVYRSIATPLILCVPNADASTQTEVETREMSTRKESKYRDAFTQTDPKLTCTCQCHLVPTSAKRRREVEEDAEHNASKRRKPVTPEQSKFLFSKTRNRSLLTSAPPKLGSRHESPYFQRIVEPTSPESSPVERAQRPSSQERVRPQQPNTPTPTPSQGGIFGSVRKIFGYLTGGTAQGSAQNKGQSQRSSLGEQKQDTTADEEEGIADQGSPTPTPRRTTYDPKSPTPNSETLDSRIYTREYFKRRRTANTIAGREQLEAMAATSENRAADFNPAQTSDSNKRKLASVDGHIPGPKQGGFGIDDSYLDVENEVEGIGESSLANTQPSTPANKRPPQTPLRSALRQTGNNFGTIGRSAKSVRINSIPDSVKAVYGQYGPAGDYRGSTFADLSNQSADSPSSLPWDVKSMHSPTTIQNTYDNTPSLRLDPTVTDPNDENWRPSPANPRPGQFRLPDFDDFDDEEDEGDIVILDQVQGDVPPQPSTPRMSHAELPQPSPLGEVSGFTGHTDSIMVNETQEIIRLNKARSDAQKYKPAKSSRLSLSEQARSRSSSPPSSNADFSESQIETSTPGPLPGRLTSAAQDSSFQATSPSQPLSRRDLDDTHVGADSMTDYQREHQYDAWAEDIFNNAVNASAPAPQSYVEAGVASSSVENLVQKTWTERDTRESIEFWQREFEEGLKAAREAREQGRELIWVTDPDEIVELEENGY